MPLHQVSPASSCLWSNSDLLLNLPRDPAIATNGRKHYRRVAIVYDDSPPKELVEGTRKLVEWRELGRPLPQSTLERKSTIEYGLASPTVLASTATPSFQTTERIAVTRSDLERCRQILRTTFKQCSTVEFRAVCCAISCIINASQPLLRRELVAATTIYDHKSARQDLARDCRKPISQQWLRKCDELLVEDYNHRIEFRSKAMSFFLRNFAIQGIDTSHKTIATICFTQKKLGEEAAHNELYTREYLAVVQAAAAFSSYAEKFGDVHLRTASLKSLPLNHGEFERFARCPRLTLNSKTPNHARDVPSALGGGHQSKSSEDSQDWVLVDEPSPEAADI